MKCYLLCKQEEIFYIENKIYIFLISLEGEKKQIYIKIKTKKIFIFLKKKKKEIEGWLPTTTPLVEGWPASHP
jgi:hypothetical protein